jgi:hypothetical protein
MLHVANDRQEEEKWWVLKGKSEVKEEICLSKRGAF